MIRQFYDSGLLFSFTGFDHTTGVHPLYYFFLLPWYPLVGMWLPIFSFGLNFAVMFVAAIFLRRVYGDLVSLITVIFWLYATAITGVINGLESTLALLGLVLVLYTIHKYESKQLVDSLKPLFLIGSALGLAMFARLDLVFVAVAFGLAWSVYFWCRRQFNFGQVKKYLTQGLAFGLPILAFFGMAVAINHYYDNGLVSAAADIKSSFPHIRPDWEIRFFHARFKYFFLANLIGLLYLSYQYYRYKSIPLSIATLWLGCVFFQAFNFLFVQLSSIGYWYNVISILLITLLVAMFSVFIAQRVANLISVPFRLLANPLSLVWCPTITIVTKQAIRGWPII